MTEKIKPSKEIISINPDKIDLGNKEVVKDIIVTLLNLTEQLLQSNQQLTEENQRLMDEINILKGEKGKPKFKPSVPQKENDVPEQKKPKNWHKKSKKQNIKIDKTETMRVDKSTLPPDAKHKGYRTVIVQNIKLVTENIEYRLERYYSPSEHKIYEAKLPEGVNGEFGADLKAFTHLLYSAGRVPEKKIWKILTEGKILISKGQISNILTKDKQEKFTKEKEDIFKAGLESTDFFHTDDTGARHKGINYHVHVVCTALFSAFFIMSRKNKDAIKEILGLKKDEQTEKIMVSDDARQFLFISLYHALCWIHEIRHYRKMNPMLEYHRTKLREFLTKIWEFYELLKEYKKNPSEPQKELLKKEFDDLFSTKTGYEELDKRIALTREKKDKLLLVLDYPEIPLHNNPAEIGLREFVLKKRISHGTRSKDGRIAWENMMSLLDTCRKQGISFFEYVKDIFSGEYKMTRLADLITKKALDKSAIY